MSDQKINTASTDSGRYLGIDVVTGRISRVHTMSKAKRSWERRRKKQNECLCSCVRGRDGVDIKSKMEGIGVNLRRLPAFYGPCKPY